MCALLLHLPEHKPVDKHHSPAPRLLERNSYQVFQPQHIVVQFRGSAIHFTKSEYIAFYSHFRYR